MKALKTLLALITLTTLSFAQIQPAPYQERPYIEVTGIAEKEVVPDEIFISIVIREKYDNKEKSTIETQEEKLKTALKEIGIDLKDLSFSDANAGYVKVKWQSKDLITKKEFLLKVNNATTVGKVFQQLNKLDINDANVTKVNHTKIDSLRKETRILAMKAAKTKAEYLLSAIGEQAGKPLSISEQTNEFQPYDKMAGRGINQLANTIGLFEEDKPKDEIEFEKIKISSTIYAKFAIK